MDITVKKKKILYIRSGPYELNFDSYNLQEVGLGTAFCKLGFDFDIVYYSKENRDQVINIGNQVMTILWRKGIKFLRTGIYPFLFNKDFLNQYNAVIVSEYSQIMSVIVSKKHANTYLYNGPYYNLFKIPSMEKIYDALFCKSINTNICKVFCKTRMAQDYIAKKGIINSVVTGVGLDIKKFNGEKEIQQETNSLLMNMDGHRNILYVGSIIKRKNIELIIKAFVQLKESQQYSDVQLVLVGKGEKVYTEFCSSIIPDGLKKDVIWCSFIKNAQMKFVYEKADIFLLPSVKEIFGMVLLEAMYFGKSLISSHSAGADTLVETNISGIIIDTYDVTEWKNKIEELLDSDIRRMRMGEEAHERIVNYFSWDAIAEKMLDNMMIS